MLVLEWYWGRKQKLTIYCLMVCQPSKCCIWTMECQGCSTLSPVQINSGDESQSVRYVTSTTGLVGRKLSTPRRRFERECHNRVNKHQHPMSNDERKTESRYWGDSKPSGDVRKWCTVRTCGRALYLRLKKFPLSSIEREVLSGVGRKYLNVD